MWLNEKLNFHLLMLRVWPCFSCNINILKSLSALHLYWYSKKCKEHKISFFFSQRVCFCCVYHRLKLIEEFVTIIYDLYHIPCKAIKALSSSYSRLFARDWLISTLTTAIREHATRWRFKIYRDDFFQKKMEGTVAPPGQILSIRTNQ